MRFRVGQQQGAFCLVGLDSDKYVVSDPDFYRPGEVNILVGNAAKAWAPQTVFEGLVREMVAGDCESLGIDAPVSKISEVLKIQVEELLSA